MIDLVGCSFGAGKYHLLKANGVTLCGRQAASTATREQASNWGLRQCAICRLAEGARIRGRRSFVDTWSSSAPSMRTIQPQGRRFGHWLEVARSGVRNRWQALRKASSTEGGLHREKGLSRLPQEASSLYRKAREQVWQPWDPPNFAIPHPMLVVGIGVIIASSSVSVVVFLLLGP